MSATKIWIMPKNLGGDDPTAFMKPSMFLRLAAKSPARAHLFDPSKVAQWTEPPYLTVDVETRSVHEHEGRSRVRAMMHSGYDLVEVSIRFMPDPTRNLGYESSCGWVSEYAGFDVQNFDWSETETEDQWLARSIEPGVYPTVAELLDALENNEGRMFFGGELSAFASASPESIGEPHDFSFDPRARPGR